MRSHSVQRHQPPPPHPPVLTSCSVQHVWVGPAFLLIPRCKGQLLHITQIKNLKLCYLNKLNTTERSLQVEKELLDHLALFILLKLKFGDWVCQRAQALIMSE